MDSRTLFTRQVEEHFQVLCDLLACPAGKPLETEIIENGLVSTRLLAGTSELMDFGEWASLLNGFHKLLDCYKRLRHPWDDRLSQVTSELIEREEALVSAHSADPETDLRAAVSPEELNALVSELAALREECEAKPPAEPIEADAVDLYSLGAREIGSLHPDGPLGGIITAMHDASQRVIDRMGEASWQARGWGADDCEEIRSDLGVLQFFSRTIEPIIHRSAGDAGPARSSLEPLRIALWDFCSELSHDSDRELIISIDGENQPIDAHFLYAAGSVLQSMIADIFSRCGGKKLNISIAVSLRAGALRWRVADDGDNHISDSQLDHEDHLAFYPGLRDVTRTLVKHHGVLWVEPGNGREARFEFTLPATSDEESVHMWDVDGQKFAVRASQLCEVIAKGCGARGDDSYGEFLEYDNRRVPLVRLDVLFGKAPGKGDLVAVVGCLERRLAFYVPDKGSPQVGQRAGDSVPVWDGPPQLMVQIDGHRVPVIDPESMLNYYHDLTGTMGSDDSSGGAMDNESDLFQSQAASKAGVPSPPDSPESNAAGNEPIEVLVVEQNETMRDTLADILNDSRVVATCAVDVEEAMSFIHRRAPSLIISEFRMPTMAAKKLVDSLRDEGMSIPVIVTTSQSGKTADLLVEKLGASGYLSKPLRRSEVTSQVSTHLKHVIKS
ncbi:MAG: response regulator [Candidatus Krumholzibacteriota bacterium]|nr:response regulator [Candidatus Krumholzibacteriota bacterium]